MAVFILFYLLFNALFGVRNQNKAKHTFCEGVKKIETSVPQQKVMIVYNGKQSNYNDFVKAFGKIGYEIKRRK